MQSPIISRGSGTGVLRSIRKQLGRRGTVLVAVTILFTCSYMTLLATCALSPSKSSTIFCRRETITVEPLPIVTSPALAIVDNVKASPKLQVGTKQDDSPVRFNLDIDPLGRTDNQALRDEFTAHVPFQAKGILTCNDPLRGMHASTASSYVIKLAFESDVVHSSTDEATKNEWNIWALCGTSQDDRMKPMSKFAAKGKSIVLNLPGKTQFAYKAGLWAGLENQFGSAAGRIVPPTFIRPFENISSLLEYAEAHPKASFIFKMGKHRQKGVKLVGAKEDLKNQVEMNRPLVVQLSVETVRKDNKRTAFRTYVWVRCTRQGRSAALIDWRSPGYVAETESDFVASGYTPNAHLEQINTWDLIVALFPNENLRRKLVLSVESKVAWFLGAFEQQFCVYEEEDDSDHDIFSKSVVEELIGFDWIPTLTEDTKEPDALLLEANRFPDMAIHGVSEPTLKDWLKICTVMRRFSSTPIRPRFNGCYTRIKESAVKSRTYM